MEEELYFNPVTGKLDKPPSTAEPSYNRRSSGDVVRNKRMGSKAYTRCLLIPENCDRMLVSNPNPTHAVCTDVPFFSVETIHISCKSDAYQGTDYCYAGVIIYSCDGKSEWQTTNGTRCKSGYVVIMDINAKKLKPYQQQGPGLVHGAVYRRAFGEECTARNVMAEGFSVMKGVFKLNSGVFNPTQHLHHAGVQRSLHQLKEVVDHWMDAGDHFYRCRDFLVKDFR